ncbi:MAG: hypothetical protein LCH46_06090 [Proteobacteria bacterium]|nr:hypothetical protein [Pseudomonadota bacterium]
MTNDNTPSLEQTAAQKKLLRLVYIMGMILVLLFLLLIAGIIWRATRQAPPPKPADITLGLGLKASDVKDVDLDGGLMAVTTSQELIVVDVSKRKVLLREPLAP